MTVLSDEQMRAIVPALRSEKHKGQAGRVGVMGGSTEYTGAPYYAGMSALRAGADLAHIFCTSAAATPIKCYSPELIVHPLLLDDKAAAALEHTPDDAARISADAVLRWAPSLDVLVIGPGLGRDECVLRAAHCVVLGATRLGLPVVLDGDGLWMVNTHLDAVRGNKHALLTPNAVEYRRLCKAAGIPDTSDAPTLARALGGVAILRKAADDVVTDGTTTLLPVQEGSPRRCGGQGDVLAGTAGLFFAWASAWSHSGGTVAPALAGGYCAARLTRRCANRAFARLGRATLTTALIEEIGPAFEELFGRP